MPTHRSQLARIVCFAIVSVFATTPVSAQVGIGGRLAWVTADTDSEVDVDTPRFEGGQIRVGMSARWGLEVSFDFHNEEFELLNREVKERQIQTSLLYKFTTGRVQPYLLGGPGWYKRSVEPLVDPVDELEADETEFGWHAGGGLEVMFGRHVGLHGDYRYTFLDFDDDDDDGFLGDLPGVGSILPGHRGSMWTLGATLYF